MRCIRNGLLISATILCCTVVAFDGRAQSDVTPPVLTGFSFTPTTIDTTAGPATVDVSFSATDDLSGVRNLISYLYGPSGQSRVCNDNTLDSGDPFDGTYSCTITIPQFSEAGTWTFNRVQALDMIYNNATYAAADLAILGFPTLVNNVAVVSDTTVPVLTAFSFSPATVDTTSGPTDVDVTFSFTDDLSGVQNSIAYLYGPSGQFRTCNDTSVDSGDPWDGDYSCSVTLPQYSEPGTWTFNRVRGIDQLNNSGEYTASQLAVMGFPSLVTNVASAADTTPPTITAFSISPSLVNTSLSAATIDVEFSATDDIAGVQNVIASLHSTLGQIRSCNDTSVNTGDEFDGTYSCTITIPHYSHGGIWTFNQVQAVDGISNSTVLGPAELIALGFPSTVTNTSITDQQDVTPGMGVSTSLLGGTGSTGGIGVTLDTSTGGTVSVDYAPDLTPSEAASVVPDLFNIVIGDPAARYQIWNIEFSGDLEPGSAIEIIFNYDETLLTDEASLEIGHCPSGQSTCLLLTDLPTTTIDTEANTVTVVVNSLSPFVVLDGIPAYSVPGLPALGLLSITIGLLHRARRHLGGKG